MKFKYQAKTQTGEDQIGYVDAPNRDAAAGVLSTHQLYVMNLEEAERPHWYDELAAYFNGARRKEKAILYRQLATLLEARIPLNTALKTLYQQTAHPALKEAILQVTEDIDAGLSFSQAIERQGAVFPDFYVAMVRVAEVTGKLDEVAGFLADYFERENELRGNALSSMVYPGLVVGLFLVVAFIMVTFVFPQIKPIFDQSGVKLPLFTRILLGSGQFLGQWWFAVLLALFVLIVMGFDYAKMPEGKALMDDVKIKTPVVNKVYMPLTLTRIANSMNLLLRGGIPVAQALEIVGRLIGNVIYEEIFRDIADAVRQGVPLSQAIAKYPQYFPILIPQMLSVSEVSGRMDQTFERIGKFYEREANERIRNVVDLIQPLLLIVVGGLVGLLFASILMPLYQLAGALA